MMKQLQDREILRLMLIVVSMWLKLLSNPLTSVNLWFREDMLEAKLYFNLRRTKCLMTAINIEYIDIRKASATSSSLFYQ
jgi:hypothetical protein